MERLTVYDRAELATDVGPNPRHITVLLTLAGPAPGVDEVRRRMRRAVAAEPRLSARVRHRAARPPVWEPVPIDVPDHVTARLTPGGDPVDVALDDLARPLPTGAPPWRLTVVDVGDPERSALVWTSHHLLGNGPSLLGLLLETLGDVPRGSPWRTPGRPRVRAGSGTGPDSGPGSRAGGGTGSRSRADDERPPRTGRAGRSPLVRPVTSGTVAVPVSVEAAAVRAGARTCEATVNDALLWAWARAYHRADLARGGPGEQVALSVPATLPGTRFGNHLGTLRVAVPADLLGDPADGLARLAARTRSAKRRLRPWAWPLAPFGARLVARLGLLPWFLRRQRLISTVVTHAPGPPGPVRLVDVPLVATAPLVPLVGNVTTCVAALSISGRLDAAVLCAPESADLVQTLADDLRDGLRQVADLARRLP
ncbi:WS/DGAT domain-containing protein [Cellulomonas algicola]|uniref:WS/DGAT domain-containing protein n=1 Tax=Cellulomonas algicola TaxID=2071633 RepID=UPI001C3F846F|nr:WS/DGAT domain-containing protein [Cellulomonas algicola]